MFASGLESQTAELRLRPRMSILSDPGVVAPGIEATVIPKPGRNPLKSPGIQILEDV